MIETSGSEVFGMGAPADSSKEKGDSPGERRQKLVLAALAALLLLVCIAAFMFFEARDFGAQHSPPLSGPPGPAAAKVEKLPAPPAVKQSLLPPAQVRPNSKPSGAVGDAEPATGVPPAAVQRRVAHKKRAPKRVRKKSFESFEEPLEGASGQTQAARRAKTGDLLEVPLPQ
ncbi:MAG: hypothetical protein ACP5SH_04815 [Syntrophobacteraceae bacterium]